MRNSTSETAEVLIAGAGPAGCTAGILLAREGIRVTILERQVTDHWKICGDMLGPRSLWFLDSLGIGWKQRGRQGFPIRSMRVYDERRMRSWAPFCEGGPKEVQAEAIRRDAFDRYLRQKAQESGCCIRYGASFRSVLAREGGRVVFRVAEQGTDRLWTARMILGADGAGSNVARTGGLRVPRSRKRILAARAYFRNVEGLGDSMELYFLRRYLPGYAWLIPLGDGMANVGMGMRADACRRNGIRPVPEVLRFLGEHPILSRRMKCAGREGRVQGWTIGGYGENRPRSAAHLLLLGDAGHLADPFTGEGIYGAMKSAAMAAPIVVEAFERGDFSRAFLSGYDRSVKRYFDGAYQYGMWLSSLPSDHGLLEPLVRWGLMQVGKNSVLDRGYARKVGGFFSGILPGRRMMRPKWFLRTLLG